MPEFQSSGATVHYELLGSGPPVLLIAGIASDGASWGPVLPLLAEKFRLILIDNRGAGQTRFAGAIAISDMVTDCVALLDHLHIERASVVGHSMGGIIGQRLAAGFPQRVARLVTLAASDRIGPKERVLFHDMARLYFTLEPQAWFRLLYQWLFSAPFFADEQRVADAAEASALYPHRQCPEAFARQVVALDAMQPINLRRIACPVLAVAAEHDLLAPAEAVLSAHAEIGVLQTLVVKGAAHSVHWEAPEPVATAVRHFLLRAA